jgi:hypothetical protein
MDSILRSTCYRALLRASGRGRPDELGTANGLASRGPAPYRQRAARDGSSHKRRLVGGRLTSAMLIVL